MHNLKEIKVLKAELDELIQPELDIESRINEKIKAYIEREDSEREENLEVLGNREIEKWEPELKKLIATLQLEPAEIEMFEERLEADLLINPCAIAAHSPTFRCEYVAILRNFKHWKYGVALTNCTFSAYQNEINADCTTYGYGRQGRSFARVYAWEWFYYMPYYPTARWILVKPRIHLHGHYYLTGTSSVSLMTSVRGYQRGYYLGGRNDNLFNQTGPALGRYDQTVENGFWIPVDAQPFIVHLGVILTARAQNSGSLAHIDFSSGRGNYIRIPWVNTSSPF